MLLESITMSLSCLIIEEIIYNLCFANSNIEENFTEQCEDIMQWYKEICKSFQYFCFLSYTLHQIYLILFIFKNISYITYENSFDDYGHRIIGNAFYLACIVFILVGLTDSIESSYEQIVVLRKRIDDKLISSQDTAHTYIE